MKCAFSCAQSITGVIKTKSGATLVGASVVITTADGNIVSYCISGEKGIFKLNIPDNGKIPATVSVSFMGFQKKVFPFSGLKNGMTIILEENHFQINFQLSHTTQTGNVWNIDSYFSYNYLPGRLLTINGKTEKLNLEFISAQNNLKYKLKIANQYLNNDWGINYDFQTIGVSLDNSTASTIYQFLRAYWSPSMSFMFGRHHLDIKLKFSYVRLTYQQMNSHHVWMDPSLVWNWKASAVSEFSAAVNYINSPVMGKFLYNTPVFTDYRTITTNRGVTDVQQKLSITFAYKYSNPITGLFFNLRPMYNASYGNILYQSHLDNNIYSLTATDKVYKMQTTGLSAHVSKAFSWGKMLIGLGTTHTTTNYKLLLAGSVNKARTTMTLVNVDYSMRPVQKLSIEGKSIMNLFEQKNVTHKDFSAGTTIDWQHLLKLYIFPSETWMLSLKNALYHTNEGG